MPNGGRDSLTVPRALWDALLRAHAQGRDEVWQGVVQEVERCQARLDPGLEDRLLAPLRGYPGPRFELGTAARMLSQPGAGRRGRICVPPPWVEGLAAGPVIVGPGSLEGQRCLLCLPAPAWAHLEAHTPEVELGRLRTFGTRLTLGVERRLGVPQEVMSRSALRCGTECVWVSRGWGLALLSPEAWAGYCRGLGGSR